MHVIYNISNPKIIFHTKKVMQIVIHLQLNTIFYNKKILEAYFLFQKYSLIICLIVRIWNGIIHPFIYKIRQRLYNVYMLNVLSALLYFLIMITHYTHQLYTWCSFDFLVFEILKTLSWKLTNYTYPLTIIVF